MLTFFLFPEKLTFSNCIQFSEEAVIILPTYLDYRTHFKVDVFGVEAFYLCKLYNEGLLYP